MTKIAKEPEQPAVGEEPSASWRRGFWSLFLTQFQGAFSDNAFKFLVMFLVMAVLPQEQRDRLVPAVGAIFALPFILFSMLAGYLSDRYSKRWVAIGTKVTEVGIMLLALLGLALGNIPILIVCVFLLSTQSAFFGPAKYGLLPELLPEKRLSWGNGMLGLGTFLAIITGTVAGGLFSEWYKSDGVGAGVVLLLLAGAGLTCSLGITRVPAADRGREFHLNFWPQFVRHWRMIRKDRPLFLAVLGDAYFWFLGALMQVTIMFYGKETLQLADTQVSLLMAALAIGIGVGSCAAGYLSGPKIEYGLTPLGAMGVTVFTALMALPQLGFLGALTLLSALGFFSGFYIVPLLAMVQHRPDPKSKGSVIATVAVLAFMGVFLASCVYYLLRLGLGLSLRQIFLVASLMTLAGTTYVVWRLPHALLRLLLWLLTHTLYRIRMQGRDRLPDQGGALLVSNHLSLVDALFILASTDRQVRFVMPHEVYEWPWLRPFARLLKVIPVSTRQHPREMLQSLEVAAEAIGKGELVCLFAEGQVTRTGRMMPFGRGLERIMSEVEAPIIPVSLDGVWGSIFSFERGRLLWKWPQRIPYPVTVSYGRSLPHDAPALEVRRAVQELQTEAWAERKHRMRTLHRAFIRTARLHPRRFAMADVRQPPLGQLAALARVIFLARRLREAWSRQEKVALVLPTSVTGALVTWAALLSGKVPIHINYTLSREGIRSCLEQCGIGTVLTSREFLKQSGLRLPCRTDYIEEFVQMPGRWEMALCWLLAGFMPSAWLEMMLGGGRTRELQDLATVLFSSGSTGEPKGVMLSHYNLVSNIEQLGQAASIPPGARLLGVLPFFHSFGFTGTLCLPAVLGGGVVYQANPLDGRTVGELVQRHGLTHILAAPSFLQSYLRRCRPEQMRSLTTVITGAEALPQRLADTFAERFGVRPLEAYGCTECSPAVTINPPDVHGPEARPAAAKHGSIGPPLPGVSVRIVDPDSGEVLPLNQPGLLLVKGPNLMMGYLGQPEKTAEVLRDGYYVTGDIASEDKDGFLTLTDRLSRFSKIGGEMVPHIKVEQALHELAGRTERTFVVTGVPDERKGERLVVFHILTEASLESLLQGLAECDLPNLWKPRRTQFRRLERFPLLATGKLDLRRLQTWAREGVGARPSVESHASSSQGDGNAGAASSEEAGSNGAGTGPASTPAGSGGAASPATPERRLVRLSRKEKKRRRKRAP